MKLKRKYIDAGKTSYNLNLAGIYFFFFYKRKPSSTSQYHRSEDHKFYNISVYTVERVSCQFCIVAGTSFWQVGWLWCDVVGKAFHCWFTVGHRCWGVLCRPLQQHFDYTAAILWHPLACSNITAGFVSWIYCSWWSRGSSNTNFFTIILIEIENNYFFHKIFKLIIRNI